VTNAYGVPPEKLGGQPSSKFIAQAFSGAKLVKGFNHADETDSVPDLLELARAPGAGRSVIRLTSLPEIERPNERGAYRRKGY